MRFLRRAALFVAAATALLVLWLFAVWPPPLWYRTHFPATTAFMQMRGSGARPAEAVPYHPVPLTAVAPDFIRAVVVAEDHRFWTHSGIDFVELRRALGYRRSGFSWASPGDVFALIGSMPRAWERRAALRGASTITQQLAKNLYLSPSRNPLRKLKEAVTAYRLEAALGKRRILELYVNVAELGPGVWGVDAASWKYFDRPARALSRQQSAALAATLPFPLASNPDHRPARMRWRQALILRRMRGERVEVPAAEVPAAPEPPAVDSLLDSLRAPVETLPPVPPELQSE